MRVQDGSLEILSDIENVVRIATGLLHGERQSNNEGDADLWNEFVTELGLKATRQLDFVWVKEHAAKSSSTGGSPPLWTKGRNDAADVLASSSAARHASLQALIEAGVALSTHMFVADLRFKRRDILLSMSEVDHG